MGVHGIGIGFSEKESGQVAIEMFIKKPVRTMRPIIADTIQDFGPRIVVLCFLSLIVGF